MKSHKQKKKKATRNQILLFNYGVKYNFTFKVMSKSSLKAYQAHTYFAILYMGLTPLIQYSQDQHISYRELPASLLELKECLGLASIIRLLFLVIKKIRKKSQKNAIKSNL